MADGTPARGKDRAKGSVPVKAMESASSCPSTLVLFAKAPSNAKATCTARPVLASVMARASAPNRVNVVVATGRATAVEKELVLGLALAREAHFAQAFRHSNEVRTPWPTKTIPLRPPLAYPGGGFFFRVFIPLRFPRGSPHRSIIDSRRPESHGVQIVSTRWVDSVPLGFSRFRSVPLASPEKKGAGASSVLL